MSSLEANNNTLAGLHRKTSITTIMTTLWLLAVTLSLSQPSPDHHPSHNITTPSQVLEGLGLRLTSVEGYAGFIHYLLEARPECEGHDSTIDYTARVDTSNE